MVPWIFFRKKNAAEFDTRAADTERESYAECCKTTEKIPLPEGITLQSLLGSPCSWAHNRSSAQAAPSLPRLLFPSVTVPSITRTVCQQHFISAKLNWVLPDLLNSDQKAVSQHLKHSVINSPNSFLLFCDEGPGFSARQRLRGTVDRTFRTFPDIRS